MLEFTSQPPVPLPPQPPRHVVLVVDTNCQQAHLDNLRTALPAALQVLQCCVVLVQGTAGCLLRSVGLVHVPGCTPADSHVF